MYSPINISKTFYFKVKANENQLEIIHTPTNAESPNLQTNMNTQLNTQAQLQHQKLLQQQQILHQHQQQTQNQQIQLKSKEWKMRKTKARCITE